jgi:O-antigen ligase
MNKIFWLFVFLLALAPLPFGMVYGVFQAFFACCVMALMLAWGILQLRAGHPPLAGLKPVRAEAAGFFAVLAWGLFQLAPFSPASWHHPLWADVESVLGREVAAAISLVRGDGLESILRIFTYGCVFFLALHLGRDRRRAEQLFWALGLIGTACALYGLGVYFAGADQVLWVETAKGGGVVRGTFINRNNFATLTGLALVCLSGLYLQGFFRTLARGHVGRDRLYQLLQQAFVRGAFLLAAMLILLTALFLSQSRAGVVASLTALSVLIIFQGLLVGRAGRTRTLLVLSVLTMVLAVFFLSGDGWLDRLTGTDIEREKRLQVYGQTWDAIGQSPWTGYGIGSFEQTFFMFADEQTVTAYKAHNDWLEMIFELGLPLALVWFLVLGGLGLRCLLGFFRRRRDHVYPLAGFAASLLVGLHALVDFSLQIPAVAAFFAVILGVGVAQSRSSREG